MSKVLTLELVDLLAPDHGRTSCSDDDLANGYYSVSEQKVNGVVVSRQVEVFPRCNRCFLVDHLGCDLDDLPGNLVVTTSLDFSVKQPKVKVISEEQVNG